MNNVDFSHFTREEAANFLLNVRRGEQVRIRTQHKMDSEWKTGLMRMVPPGSGGRR